MLENKQKNSTDTLWERLYTYLVFYILGKKQVIFVS